MIEAAAPTSSSPPRPANVVAPSNPRAWIMTGMLTINVQRMTVRHHAPGSMMRFAKLSASEMKAMNAPM